MSSIEYIFYRTLDNKQYQIFIAHYDKFNTVLDQLTICYGTDFSESDGSSNISMIMSDDDFDSDYRKDEYVNGVGSDSDGGGLYGEYDDWESYYDSVYQ